MLIKNKDTFQKDQIHTSYFRRFRYHVFKLFIHFNHHKHPFNNFSISIKIFQGSFIIYCQQKLHITNIT